MPTFKDYPEFRPNLTPRQIFKMGSFGGTYWRPIRSKITGKSYRNKHKKYPKSWWEGISNDKLTRDFDDYDRSVNKYKVKVGTTLQFWEKKKWITRYHPYGWVHWYCDFYMGRRCPDDERQIKRWLGLAGPNGRFRKWLISSIKKKRGKYDDYRISPAIRQTLQHWGYKLTKAHFEKSKRQRGGSKAVKKTKRPRKTTKSKRTKTKTKRHIKKTKKRVKRSTKKKTKTRNRRKRVKKID